MERIVFMINYTKLMSRQSLFSNLKVGYNINKQFLVSFVSFVAHSLPVWFRLKCSHSASICIIWIFLLVGYLQENLLLIHVILRDGACPAYSYWECTSALKCLLSPRDQMGKSLGVISHSVIILFRNFMGFLSGSSNWLQSEREDENILKCEFEFDTVEKPRTCQLNANYFVC